MSNPYTNKYSSSNPFRMKRLISNSSQHQHQGYYNRRRLNDVDEPITFFSNKINAYEKCLYSCNTSTFIYLRI